MQDERSRSRRLTRSAALLSALALVGFGPTTAAYAAKPTSPPGQTQKSATQHRTSGTAGTSGDATSPQPRSRADRNGAGANQSGAYDSTRDGSPSRNGNGSGKATGKPCAGCVGKADNKNPPGQAPNGSDRNAGYECDRNNGIGKTNPAHTGCTTDTPPTAPEEPSGPEVPPGLEEPEAPQQPGPEQPHGPCVDLPATPEDDCGEVLAPGPEVPGAASPASTTSATTGDVQAAPAPSAQVLDGDVTERSAARALPQTGAASGALLTALAGLLLLGAGVALTRLRPRVRA